MMRIWTWLFTPATVCIGIGLVLLAVAAADPSWPQGALLAAASAIVLIGWVWVFRPILGAED